MKTNLKIIANGDLNVLAEIFKEYIISQRINTAHLEQKMNTTGTMITKQLIEKDR